MKRLLRVICPLVAFLVTVAVPAVAQDDGHAPATYWLPPRSSNDQVPVRIDHLFSVILWLTSVVMIAVFITLIYFLLKYRARPGRRGTFTHGNHSLELIWTIVPACILVWLGITQVPDWNRAKVPSQFPDASQATVVRVFAQQFDWNFRQAGIDGKFESYDNAKAKDEWKASKNDPTKAMIEEFDPLADKYFGAEDDDDIVMSSLVVPVGKPVLIELRAADVTHAIFLPEFRLKQDAVPGKPMPVWFMPSKVGEYEIACAELCGNNHTTMRAWLKVVTQDEWENGVKDPNTRVKWAGFKKESEKHNGTVDRGGENVWKNWFRQDPVRPWNELRLEKQLLTGPKSE